MINFAGAKTKEQGPKAK